jgi:hypothetical protein
VRASPREEIASSADEGAIVHVLNEALSPVEASVWRMLCGEECVALDDGTLIPALDFYLESAGHKADCEACRAVLEGRS